MKPELAMLNRMPATQKRYDALVTFCAVSVFKLKNLIACALRDCVLIHTIFKNTNKTYPDDRVGEEESKVANLASNRG